MRKIAGKLRELGETVYCPFELKIENAWDYSQEDWEKMVIGRSTEQVQNDINLKKRD